jgi:Flp pilus assembly protein TadG
MRRRRPPIEGSHATDTHAIRARAPRRGLRDAERGATVVEAALVTPLFVFILFALVELGPLFQQWSTGKNAATEGGRMGATAGSSVTADWETFRELRNSLTKLGGNLDYAIIFRAGQIRDDVPQECIAAAEANRQTALTTPVGVFQADASSPVITDHTNHAVEDFDWNSGTPPRIACTVLYQRHFQGITSSIPFVYDRAKVLATAPDTPEYSLNRFWPSQFRVDYLNGPQDYVGIYVQSRYYGPTGILKTRVLKNTSINQIEPKRASR